MNFIDAISCWKPCGLFSCLAKATLHFPKGRCGVWLEGFNANISFLAWVSGEGGWLSRDLFKGKCSFQTAAQTGSSHLTVLNIDQKFSEGRKVMFSYTSTQPGLTPVFFQ